MAQKRVAQLQVKVQLRYNGAARMCAPTREVQMEIKTSTRTYASRENAVKAFHKVFGPSPQFNWTIASTEDGRFFPLCVGERAMQAGAHFHFAVTN